MKRGNRKALELALRMLEWAKKRNIYSEIEVYFDVVDFSSQMQSFRNVHQFKKAFPEVGVLNRDTSEGSLNYNGKVGNLKIDFYAIEKLPPSCKLVTEEVTIAEELIPGHIEPEHTETVTKIVCGNGEQTEETEALLNEN